MTQEAQSQIREQWLVKPMLYKKIVATMTMMTSKLSNNAVTVVEEPQVPRSSSKLVSSI